MSTALPPRAVRILRRGSRLGFGFAFKVADRVTGDGGFAGTGVGPRGAAAPVLMLATLAGSETAADAMEAICVQWLSEAGDKVGDIVRAKVASRSGEKAAAAAKAAAADARTVDQVIAPQAERVPAVNAPNGVRKAAS